MKRLAFIAISAATLFACGNSNQNENNPNADYNVQGIMGATFEGEYIYIAQPGAENFDSARVTDGKFAFSGSLDNQAIYRIKYNREYIDLATDTDPVEILWNENFKMTKGGVVNSNLRAMDSVMLAYNEEFRTFYMSNPQAEREIIMAKYEEYMSKLGLLFDDVITKYGNSIESVYALQYKASNIESLALLDSLSNAIPMASFNNIITKRHDLLVQRDKVKVGEKFIDFDATDINGKPVKFSDYIGKGNYVMVDFWASWCGPCKAEIPNLKEVYNKHKANGLVFIGVNVWDKHDKFLSSIEQFDMSWENIYASHNNNATDTYAIDGIPCIMLFSPDGTIVNRTMRGPEIMQIIDEIYAK